MKYYVDTCVWIDFVEERYDVDIFMECIRNENIVVYSYPLEKELLKHLSLDKIRALYEIFSSKKLIETVDVSYSEKSEAYLLATNRNVPFVDALHAILARDNDAVLVTRDKHFLQLKDICKLKLL